MLIEAPPNAPNQAAGRRTFLAASACGTLVPGLMAFPEDASALFPFGEEAAVKEVEAVRRMEGNLGVSGCPLLWWGETGMIAITIMVTLMLVGQVTLTGSDALTITAGGE